MIVHRSLPSGNLNLSLRDRWNLMPNLALIARDGIIWFLVYAYASNLSYLVPS
jgi:hypothetical protein